jgi:hypothetical protein
VQGAWEMEAARKRVVARVFCHIGQRLDIPNHPTVSAARERLQGDTPEQYAADLEVLQRWKARHPNAFPPDEEGCNRIMRKLDETAQRMGVYRELRAQN